MPHPARKPQQHDDDLEHTPLTPRGMAAPPAGAPAAHRDADHGRPATIRIEANTRPMFVHPRGYVPASPHTAAAAVPSAAREAPMDRLQGLVLSQGLLLNAFVVLLVFGWSSPLPGRRLLLGAFALGGIVVAVLIHFALRSRQGKRSAAARAARQPGMRGVAMKALPAALATGWVALGFYALALPPTANAFQENRPAAPAAQVAPQQSAQAAAAPAARPADAPAPAAQSTKRWNFRP